MYGTELQLARRQMREELKNDVLGTARQGGYYDEDELLAHVGPAASYAPDRVVTTWVIAVGLLRMGVPVEKIAAAYRLDPDAIGSWNVHQVLLSEGEKAEIERQMVAMIPESPEPSRFVPAVHQLGGLQADQNTGRPMSPTVSPMGATHFAKP